MIAIDKDKPIPLGSVAGNTKYPWREMEVGDSFFVPGKRPGAMHSPQSIKNKGWEFVYRTETNDSVTGCRVWRVK